MVALEIQLSKWRLEFFTALPSRWRNRFGSKQWVIVGDDIEDDALARSSHGPFAIVLPKTDFLIRQISLPLASSSQISSLMQFEASRHVPLPLDKACIDYRIVRHDIYASRTTVELVVIRREVFDAALERAKLGGLRIEAVYVVTQHGEWFSRRPIGLDWRTKWFARRHQIQYLRVGIPTLLLLFWVLAAQNWAVRLAADRDATEVTARNQAIGIEPLRQKLAALDDKIGFLHSARERPSVAAVSEEIARLLPDDAWLQELDIEDQTVRATGTAENATDLLKDFSTSSFLTNPQFEAPLTQAMGTKGDQFDILMTRP